MPEPVRARLSELLTFDEIPDADELNLRARDVALVMEGDELGDPCLQAMIGGAPFFMRYLECGAPRSICRASLCLHP